MNRYLVWDPLNESESRANEYEAHDPDDACECWAVDDEMSGEPFKDYVDLIVRDVGGTSPDRYVRIGVDYSRDYHTSAPPAPKEPT